MSQDDKTTRDPEPGGARGGEDAGPAGEAPTPDSLLSLDPTPPPAWAARMPAAHGTAIHVFTRDADLAGTVREAAGEKYTIHVVEDWLELEQLVEQRRCGIVLLDVEALPETADRSLDRLGRFGPGLVVLIAAERGPAESLIELLSARRVHRLLIKPAALGVTGLLLESAVNRYLQLQQVPSDPFDTPVEGLTRRPYAGQRERRAGLSAAAVLGGVLAIGVVAATALGPGGLAEWRTLGGWIAPDAPGPLAGLLGGSGAERPDPDAPPGSAADRARDGDGAAGGDNAEREQARDDEPAAQSADTGPAAESSDAAETAADPTPEEADTAETTADAAREPTDTAETAADAPSQSADAAEAVADSAAESADADETAARDAAEPDAAAGEPAEPFAERLEQAEAALEAGRLAPPTQDNALEHYEAILEQAPGHERAARGRREALDNLFGRAERELVAGNLEVAGETVDQIRRVQPDSARLTILESQLASALEQAADDVVAAAEQAAAAHEVPAADDDAAAVEEAATGEDAAAVEGAASDAEAAAAEGAASGEGAAAAEGAASDEDVAAVELPASDSAPFLESAAPGADAARAPGEDPQDAGDPELEGLLAAARERIDAGALIEPAGDSARDYLRRAESRRSDDPRLVDLRSRLAAAVAADARVALGAGDLDEAEALVEAAFELGLDSETQTQLDLELGAARERAARREHARWLELARTRIREGALIAPEDDSARHYLARLEREQPGFDGLAAGWSALADALAERAGRAIEGGDWARAEEALAWLERADAEPERLAGLRERLERARAQAEYLSEPAGPAEMTLVEAGGVEYPDEAQQADIEGWADVEFVVDEQGRPTQARVVAAEPEGYFEEAAVESVERSRYEPFEADGRIYERLVRVRVRFDLR